MKFICECFQVFRVLFSKKSNLYNVKTCSKCKTSKDLTEFYKNKTRHDGLCALCKECDKKKPVNREKARARFERYRNSEKGQAYFKNYYLKNKETCNKQSFAWAKANPEKMRVSWLRHSKTEHGLKRHRFQEAKRRAMKISATPSWVNMKEIKDFYMNCPAGYHVDHIIPLNHPLVCGLHILWNLQYLPALENIRKNNKVEGLDGK